MANPPSAAVVNETVNELLPAVTELIVGAEGELGSEKTRTCPASIAVPPLKIAPMAMRVPSGDIATEYPEESPAASPSISVSS